MQGTDTLRPAIGLAPDASLPFPLFGNSGSAAPPSTPEPSISTVLDRLDTLQQMAQETQAAVQDLRHDSSQILQALLAPATPERPPTAAGTATGGGGPPEGLRFRLFGAFDVRAGDRAATDWKSRKARSLLAYLAMEPKRRVPKDVLIELFWPGSSISRGSNNLSIAVYQIRSVLKGLVPGPNHAIAVQQGLYSLDPDVACWVDVHEFSAHVGAAREADERHDRALARQHLEAAVALVRGVFLEQDLYEEWTVEPRRSYDATFGRALAWLAADAADSGDWLRLIDYATCMTARDPCDEEGHRWLMRAHWRLGNRARALLQYRTCSQVLKAELGVSPSSETSALFAAILDE